MTLPLGMDGPITIVRINGVFFLVGDGMDGHYV